MSEFTTLFTDIGGVLLTNGWDHSIRRRAAEKFGLDGEEMDERHHLIDMNYELGQLTLDDYLNVVVFYRPRSFTRDQFFEFMKAQSKPCTDTMDFLIALKNSNKLKVVAVSNEGRELTQFRIDNFGLKSLIDVFICSCFVGYRKPDAAIFNAALDIVQVDPSEVVYLDDRMAFVETAERCGLRAIHHTELEATKEELASLGLTTQLVLN